jgi:hypothetical protein
MDGFGLFRGGAGGFRFQVVNCPSQVNFSVDYGLVVKYGRRRGN